MSALTASDVRPRKARAGGYMRAHPLRVTVVVLTVPLWSAALQSFRVLRLLQLGQKLPQSSLPPPSVASTQSAVFVRQSQTRTSTAPANANSGQGRVFANCAAVRAAGLAPLRAGAPDYRANEQLDRDKDGLACK
jgi:Excalibur calcium-binding domain